MLNVCLERVINQVLEFDNAEILVVDDGSTDLTAKLLKELSDKYNFFRYIISEKNNGISITRNKLVNNASGKYIIFVDSDVFISDNLIKNHLKVLQENKNIICQSHLILIDNLNNLNKKSVLTDYSKAFFDTANVSIERSKIIEVGLFDENFLGYGWEDLELGLRLKKIGIKTIRKKSIFSYHYQEKPNINKMESFIKKEIDRAKGSVYFNQKHKSLEVKLITQFYRFSQIPTIILVRILKLEKNFVKTIEKFSEKDYNRSIFLFRTYMNYIYIFNLNNNLKQK